MGELFGVVGNEADRFLRRATKTLRPRTIVLASIAAQRSPLLEGNLSFSREIRRGMLLYILCAFSPMQRKNTV